MLNFALSIVRRNASSFRPLLSSDAPQGPGGWSFVVEQSSPATLGEKTTKAKSVAQSRAPAGSKGAKLIHQARGGGVGGGSSKGAGSGRSKSLPAGSASSAGRGAGGTGGRKRPIAAVGGCSSEVRTMERRSGCEDRFFAHSETICCKGKVE